MPACMKMYRPAAGDGWYEESTEWAVVYASFYELITTDQLAYETVVTLGYYTTVDDGSFAGRIDRARYFNSIPGGAVLRRANAFFAENQHKFAVAAVMPSQMATRKHPDWVQVAAASYDACSFMLFDLPRYPDFSGPFTKAEAIKAGATKFVFNPR